MVMNDSFDDITSREFYVRENFGSSFHNQLEENDLVQSFGMISDKVHHGSLFPLEAIQRFDRGVHADVNWESADDVADFGSDIPLALARSQPRNNLRMDTVGYTEDVFTDDVMGFRCRSSENLHFPHEYDFHNYKMAANVGKENDSADVKLKNLKQESPILNCDEQLNPKELSMRRIQDWISQIGNESDCIVEEPGESSASFSSKEPQVEADTLTDPTAKLDARSHIGAEVAHNYISSLTVTSSTAQMENLGLFAVPFLSAFVGLRVLNLSGNSIVHITAGALPRGLHMLNLSKNNIAAIEGLRDLTHLRVLDLSYNRITKIGHGLASCSSLEELYLAGNKISEVEGLHRLLKLNVLDLRSNKIATAKGLGNLAANYSSLQAINLDGNPAQSNVGDEQLKKYLLSLLPNLVYYNKHSIRASGSMKEAPERPTRSPARHFDRNPRTEHKLPRKGSHGSGLHKLPLNPIRPSPAAGPSLKQYKSRKVEAPPLHLSHAGSKLPYLLPEVDQNPVSLQPSNPIRRVQSEGNLSRMVTSGLLSTLCMCAMA
ncbi:uncharacterized protein M6B38_301040 [Iris pallida]|uniref:Uncharacterized protein n=1 Tax=Iris pallida TaxID=29817 RepID=A0AAX6HNR3_IRIPA|nr:uncharacterized protein M6B38_301040 [Iris pallida]